MKSVIVAIVAMLAIIAPALQRVGTLKGHVDIGPLRPVQRVGEKEVVPPAMYKHYNVTITMPGPQNGQMKSQLLRLVRKVEFDGKGNFTVKLAPGTYQIGISSDAPARRLPESKEVKITANRTATVKFSVDTGIR